MSRKDDLDRLEADWSRHIEWRKGSTNPMREAQPGKYLGDSRGMDYRLVLSELPQRVREAFLADFEAVIGAALDAKYQAIHRDMRKDARAEAERTLATLGADEQGGENG